MKKFVIRYGLAGGSVSILLSLLNWFLIAPASHNGSQLFGYLSIVVSLLCIPLGIRYFRDKLNQGILTFSQSFKVGMGITLVTSVIVMLYSIVFFLVEGDKFDTWRSEGMSAEAQTQMASAPEFVMSPLFQGLIMFLTVFLIGLIINLISSLILKIKKPAQA